MIFCWERFAGGCIGMTEEEGTASNAIWAIAMIIIVALIVGVIYYSGMLRGGTEKKEIDINISAPAR